MQEFTLMNCSARPFKSLAITAFLGMLSDNILYFLAATKILWLIARVDLFQSNLYPPLLAVMAVLLALTFIFLSFHGGALADGFEKSKVIQGGRLCNLILVLPAAAALVDNNLTGLFLPVLATAAVSAVLSPARYALLPEILDMQNLSRGNSWMGFANIAAFVCAGITVFFLDQFQVYSFTFHIAALAAAASAAFAASLSIPGTEITAPGDYKTVRPPSYLFQLVKEIRLSERLFFTMTAIVFFWWLAAFLTLSVLLHAGNPNMLGPAATAGILTVSALGGCLFAGRVSKGKVEVGLSAVGAGGIILCCLPPVIAPEGFLACLAAAAGAGFFAPVYLIPLNANFQKRSPKEKRGRFAGISSLLSWCSLIFGAGCFCILRPADSPRLLFFSAALITLTVAGWILRSMPYAFLRSLNWLFSHLFYNMQVHGLENLPAEGRDGGALIVCNHASYVDPVLIQASIDRPVRFLVLRKVCEHPLARPFMKVMEAIPIAPEDGPKEMLRSLQQAREAVMNGELVCIFSEGTPSRISQMLPFKSGLERIVRGVKAPIIPAYIDNVWGSILNIENGRYSWNRSRELPYPVTVIFGKPLPSSLKAFEVRQSVQELGTEAFPLRRQRYQLLHAGFIHAAKHTPFRDCMSDTSGKRLKFIHVLIGSFLLARKFRKMFPEEEQNVGIMLPTSVASAILNLALMMTGKVSVNLNFTSGQETRKLCLNQAGIKHVLTSRQFLSKLNLPEEPGYIYAEDLFQPLPAQKKIACLLFLLIAPSWLIQRISCRRYVSRDSTATIIFSSGSTGIPKGVLLSHGNIASNIESIYDVLACRKSDRIIGILPFFHSFGFTTDLWLPLLSGIPVAYHVSPLESEIIGKLVEREKGTLLLGTPTFLLNYAKKCSREQFKTLRWVVAGGEKLRQRMAIAFTEKFGMTPLEGYGCTELSPVALINMPDYKVGSLEQKGNKPGAAGHPIPGVAVRIIDAERPDDFTPLPPDTQGLLIVKGPNVMQGYLGMQQQTSQVVKNGWYITGDIASMDEAGFVTIHDRISRFSKIAGEMIPHLAIEDAVHKMLGESEAVCVVTAVADDRRGERLVVLHTAKLDVKAIIKGLGDEGVPNLWIPREDSFFKIDQIPLLGTGKLDLSAVKKLAEDLTGKDCLRA